MLSLEERKFILKTYLKTNSIKQVRAEFRKKYALHHGDKRIPSRHTIRRIRLKFDAEGSVSLGPGRKAGLTYRTGKVDKVNTVKEIYYKLSDCLWVCGFVGV